MNLTKICENREKGKILDGKSHDETFIKRNKIEEDKNELKEKGRRMAWKVAK